MPPDDGYPQARQDPVAAEHRDGAPDAYGAFSLATVDGVGRRDMCATRQVAAGRWRRLYPAVYASAVAAEHRECWWSGALIYAGREAVLCGRTAAAVFALPVEPSYDEDGEELVYVATTTRRQLRRTGRLRPRRPRRLPAADLTCRRRLAVTSLERTVLDLCGELPAADAVSIVAHVLQRRLTTVDRLHACVRRAGRAPGAAALTRLLVTLGPGHDSAFQARVITTLIRRGFPRPTLGVVISTPAGARYPDAVFEIARTVLETDGALFHLGPDSWESDIERDSDLEATGYATVRIAYRQWLRDPERCIGRLAAVLRARWPVGVELPAVLGA